MARREHQFFLAKKKFALEKKRGTFVCVPLTPFECSHCHLILLLQQWSRDSENVSTLQVEVTLE
jgi:hypothetical protein